MSVVYDEAVKSIMHDQNSVLVTIVETQGSAPGKKGSRMLVCENGKCCGTIGGGDLELFCSKSASDVLTTGKSFTRTFELDSSKQDVISMICGGSVTVEFKFIDKHCSGSDLDLIFGPEAKRPRALIFGGGHVGQDLCPVLNHIGFDVIVLDDRKEYASKSVHPDAKQCLICDYRNISDSIKINSEDYVVIMTHGHAGDRVVLLQACKTDATYIGCIGSRKKVDATKVFLRENNIPESRIAEIHSPIGLPIGGDTPAEISISVAAEIIQHRYEHKA